MEDDIDKVSNNNGDENNDRGSQVSDTGKDLAKKALKNTAKRGVRELSKRAGEELGRAGIRAGTQAGAQTAGATTTSGTATTTGAAAGGEAAAGALAAGEAAAGAVAAGEAAAGAAGAAGAVAAGEAAALGTAAAGTAAATAGTAAAGAAAAGAAGAGTAVAGTAATASAPVWGTVAVIIVIAIIIIMTIAAIVTLLTGSPSSDELAVQCPGTCQSSCTSPDVEDTTISCSYADASTGSTVAGRCCVPPLTCSDVGGTCRSGLSACTTLGETINTTAVCSGSTTPTCCVPVNNTTVPDCATVDSRLTTDLNASVVRGISWVCSGCASGYVKYPDTPDCASKISMWKVWTRLTKSSAFTTRLKSQSNRAEFFYNDSFWPKAFGYTPSSTYTQLLNARRMLASYYNLAAFWITHETMHMLQGRDRSLENSFDVSYFKTHGDSACYIGSYLKTYGCIGCSGISYTRESMSEAVGLYVYNSKVGKDGTISNFKSQCPATYSWVKTKLFPDYEYY